MKPIIFSIYLSNKPADGNEFLKVDITIKNISDKEQTVSSAIMFKVVDKDGRECKKEIFVDSNGTLDGTSRGRT